jgi:cold shock CspA family protein
MPWVWKGQPKGYGKGGWGKGWGKGGGYSGGGGGGKGFSKPQALPDDFVVDTAKLYTGTVAAYYKFNGYGFIEPDEKGVIPNDKVFAFWKNLNSTDRYPALAKEMKVQFTVNSVEKQGVKTLQAENVSSVGGGPISIQDDSDTKKDFVGGQNLRYTGTLKFFLPKQGYGYIKIDPGYQYDKEGVPEEVRVETAEMNCGGGNPQYSEEMKVEFGIWITSKGAFKGYNVTLPGGLPLPAAP